MDVYLQIADAIKKDVSAILRNAVNGYEQKYWYMGRYIRWGLVEKDIHTAIEKQLTSDQKEG